MVDTFRKLIALFSPAERRRLAGVFLAILGMGILQLAGVGSVLPFVSVLANHGLIHTNPLLVWTYSTLGFTSTNGFLIFLGFGVLVFLVASNAFVAFTIWLITRFAWDKQFGLSAALFEGYLRQPYEAFLNRNSADTGKNILYESQQFTNGVLLPAMTLTAFGVTVLFIAGFMVWLDPLLAVLVAATFGAAYALVYFFIRRPLERIGRIRIDANTERFKAVDEGFGSVKEVKVLGRETEFLGRYLPGAQRFAGSMAAQQILLQLPRYAIEALAFGIVISLFLYLLYAHGTVQGVLPLASAFALAGYRLLPALQQVYQTSSALKFNQSVVDTIYRDLIITARPPATTDSVSIKQTGEGESARLPFANELRLDNVTYTYPGAREPSLANVTMNIASNSSVAFVGATGAGKTTLADLVLGLLRPQSGRISVDGVELTDSNVRRWQANLGYVPQDIFLTDDTIAGNIAYGVPANAIDLQAMERAARVANIHHFISNKLPAGYQTVVGERGVRLSGGQRQRIGIARALYHDPEVLVLDEATSALDNDTERRIVQEIEGARAGKTLVIIAHRISTVRHCDVLYLLKGGSIVGNGTYEALVSGNDEFRRLNRDEHTVRA